VAPYKAPERNQEENEVFNKHVSKLRIRSEHAIGYLKGRFQSLKGLRVTINTSDAHIIAMYWVAACIGIHSFALKHEIQKNREQDPDFDENNPYRDPFIYEGLSDSEDDGQENAVGASTSNSRISVRLRRGKAHREKLKRLLFQAKNRRHKAHAHARHTALQAEFSISSNDSDSENLLQ
jgi:hypothetical protein